MTPTDDDRMTDEELDRTAKMLNFRCMDDGPIAAATAILAECRRARTAEREMAALFGDRLQDDALAVAERQAVLVWLRGRAEQHAATERVLASPALRNSMAARAAAFSSAADEIGEGLHAIPGFVATLDSL